MNKISRGNRKWFVIPFALISLFLSHPSHAAKFANQFIEFELPAQWSCNLVGAEWVCQNTNELKKRDAIIVLAAKLKGDQDSLDQYLTYLKGAKTYTSVQGRPVKSDVKYAKTVTINQQAWVDSLHLESEISGFFTRYLATVKQDIGVLVTYSVNKGKWKDYTTDFENMVKTLRVFRKSGPVNAAPANQNLFNTIPQSVENNAVFPNAAPAGGSDTAPAKSKEDNWMLYLVIGAAIIGFIIWKRKQNQG